MSLPGAGDNEPYPVCSLVSLACLSLALRNLSGQNRVDGPAVDPNAARGGDLWISAKSY